MAVSHLFRSTQSNFSSEILKVKPTCLWLFRTQLCPKHYDKYSTPVSISSDSEGLALKATVGTATSRSTQGMDSSNAPKQRCTRELIGTRNKQVLTPQCSVVVFLVDAHWGGAQERLFPGVIMFLQLPPGSKMKQLTWVWWTGGSIYLYRTRTNWKVNGTSTSHPNFKDRSW